MIGFRKLIQGARRPLPVVTTPTKPRNNHLFLLNQERNKPPLYIIPGTGGKSDGFRVLGNTLRGVCSVYGVDMMGTRRGETPLKTIQQIAAQNIRWIRYVQPEGPYRLVGHSFGASILYEMAQQLEDINETPDFIAVLDQNVGVVTGIPPGVTKIDIVLGLARDYFESFKIIRSPYPGWNEELRAHLEKMPMEEMVPFVAEFVAKRLPKKADSIEYFSRLINIRFYNRLMVYRPAGKISAEIIVFRAANHDWGYLDETLGWSAYSNVVRNFVVPGNHFNMVYGKNVNLVAKYLKRRITSSKY